MFMKAVAIQYYKLVRLLLEQTILVIASVSSLKSLGDASVDDFVIIRAWHY